MTRWPTLTCGVLVAAISVLSVLLRWRVPITPFGSPVDDLLYVRGGTFLAHGQWLGPFDQFTLLKLQGYPAFIALMYRSGVPLMVGEQLTYLLAAAAVAGCVRVVTRRRALALGVFLVLALDPVNFSTFDAWIYRDGWYASLSMLFVATFFLAAYGAVTRVRIRWLVPVSAIAGLCGAAFWLCREEGVWILPSILVVALGLPFWLLVTWWRAKPRTGPLRSRVLRKGGRLGLVLAVAGMALVAPVTAIAVENSRHYGAALTNDLVSGQFARAYADWRRVKAGTPSAATPLVLPQREAVYRVSSAARELQPYLEGPLSKWQSRSCRILKPCGDLAGILVPFALRDAAANAGYFDSEFDVQRFFGELDAQIQAGCASGQLSCTVRLPTQLQSLQHLSIGPLLASLGRETGRTLASTGLGPPTTPRPLTSSQRALVTQIVPGVPASQQAADEQMSRFTANNWQYRLLSLVYRLLLPLLLVMAAIGFTLPLVRLRWPHIALSVLSGAFLAGVLSRLLFVAFLATTLAPAPIRYLLPAHAFLMAFGVVGTAQFADDLRTRIRLARGRHQSTVS